MEHFELVEKLVNTFGVSYEEAKNALEASSWDPVEAAVILEKKKNGSAETENSAPKADEQPNNTQADEQPNTARGPKGSTYNIPVEEIKNAGCNFIKTIWDFLSLNTFVVKKNSGEVFLDIPIWLAAILFCAFFWPITLIMGIVFIMGYRFSFSGPQLGKTNVKNTVDQVGKATEDFVKKVKNTVAPDNCEKVQEQPAETTEEAGKENETTEEADKENETSEKTE